MTWQALVRPRVARLVWPENPSSVQLAAAAVALARVLDTGRAPEHARHVLVTVLAHLRDCDRGPGSRLDELRVSLVQHWVDTYTRSLPK